MPKVRLLNGKPLLVGGKVALSDACCCNPITSCGGTCSLPEGDCPHAICAEFWFDANDTSNGDVIHLHSNSNDAGFYLDGTTWRLYVGASNILAVPAVNIRETWHTVKIKTTYAGSGTVNWSLEVDGVSDTGDAPWAECDPITEIRTGSLFFASGDAHRLIRCITSLGNPDSAEEDFGFPTQSFDSFTGGASIVGGQLRIDSLAGADAYGEKDFDPGYDIACPCRCPRDCEEIGSMTLTVSGTANKSNPEMGCGSWTLSHSKTWTLTRIDQVESFDPDGYQFKLYTQVDPDLEGCCSVVFSAHIPAAVGGITPHDEIACSPGPGDQVKVEVITGTWGPQFEYDDSCSGDPFRSTTSAVTVGFELDGRFTGYNCDLCSVETCDILFSTGYVIPATLDDLSPIIGSYSASNSCDDGGGNITTVNVEIAFFAP